MATLLEKDKNTRGIYFAVLQDDELNDKNSLWKLCENYDGKCKGGIRKTWRLVEKDLSWVDAVNKFDKKIKGKEK